MLSLDREHPRATRVDRGDRLLEHALDRRVRIGASSRIADDAPSGYGRHVCLDSGRRGTEQPLPLTTAYAHVSFAYRYRLWWLQSCLTKSRSSKLLHPSGSGWLSGRT
jgi:hypothetical protein